MTALTVGLVSVLSTFSVSAEEDAFDISGGELTENAITMEELQDHMEEQGLTGNYRILSNDECEFLYYDQLDANNKTFYSAMQTYWTKPNLSVITVTLPEPVSFTANSGNDALWNIQTMNNYYNALYATVQGAENAFIFDYPEVFWFDANSLAFEPVYTSRRNMWTGKYTITISQIKMQASIQEVYGDIDTAEQYTEYLKECIDNFVVEGDDRYSKLKSMYESVASAVTYNIEAPYHDTALGMFLEPYQIVCEGYSEAIKLLCDREGIPCVSIVGNYDESTKIAHMWNYVQMEDGNWYGLDCTWDDRDGEIPPITYDFFLKGSDSFMKKHYLNFGYTYARFTYPELSKTDYVYQKPTVTTTPNEPTETIETTTATTITTVETTMTEPEETTTITTVTEETTLIIPERLKGDFNNDGEITIADAVFLQKKLLGVIKITQLDFLAELNDDGKLNVIDYMILVKMIQ